MSTVGLILVLCMVLASLWAYSPRAHIRNVRSQSASRQCGCNLPTWGDGGASPTTVPTIRGVRLTNQGKEVLLFSKIGLYLQHADATGDRADWLELNKAKVRFYTSGLAVCKGDMIDTTTSTPRSYTTVSREHYVALPAETSLVIDLNDDAPITAVRLGAVESTTAPEQRLLLVETSARHSGIAEATFTPGFVRAMNSPSASAIASHIGPSGIYEYATTRSGLVASVDSVTTIYNIDPKTNMRTSGFTPDPFASYLIAALPGDSLSDVSHLINPSTPAKTLGTKAGTSIASVSRFYGSSVSTFAPGRPGAILFGNFERSVVAPDAELTVEGWVNTYNPTRGSTPLFFTRPWTGGALALLITWSGSFPNCHPPGRIAVKAWGTKGAEGPLNITANAWHHFAMTKSGTTYRVFFNGTLVATTTIASVPGGTKFILGGYRSPAWGDASNWDDWDDAQAHFNDFRVYNRVKYTSNFMLL